MLSTWLDNSCEIGPTITYSERVGLARIPTPLKGTVTDMKKSFLSLLHFWIIFVCLHYWEEI